MGTGGLRPPYPHVVHWSPYKSLLRNFGIVKRRKKEKRGRREDRREKEEEENEPPWSKLWLRPCYRL